MNTTPYSEGNLDSRIAIIAEAPGRQEILRGRPLVGPSGDIFNECLQSSGLIRQQCSIHNLVRGQVSDIGTYLGEKGLTEKGKEAAADLQERLKDCNANVYLCLGAAAFTAMTGRVGITKHRGSIYESTLLPGRKVIGTFHPASTLPGRGPYINRYTIISDIRKTVAQSGFPQIVYPERELIINPRFNEVIEFLDWINHTAKEFATDIEIYNLETSCISFAPSSKLSMCIPFIGHGTDYWREDEECIIKRKIAEPLGNPNIAKIAQWGIFDVSFLWLRDRIRVRGPLLDTNIMQRILHPEFSAKLEFICSIHTDEPFYKDDRKIWARPHSDSNTFYRYNAKDSAVTFECKEALWPEVQAHPGFLWTYENTLAVFEACLYAMTRGVQLDIPRLKQSREEMAVKIDAAAKALQLASDYPFNPGSPKQCIAYFYDHKRIKPYTNRKTHKPTCDDEALARIVRKHNIPEARLVQEWRSLDKVRSTYLDLTYDADERLRCLYDPRGTYTGRLASKKTIFGTGLNMQNLDPMFKDFIVPDREEE